VVAKPYFETPELQDLLFPAIEHNLATFRADLTSKISLILKQGEI
jgi:hypothetical protein